MNSGKQAAKKRGWLKNGNPPGDFMKARRCGAKNRQGNPCKCPAMKGKRRCRLHGGKSTGAKTKAGIHRIRAGRWTNGARSERLQREFRAWCRKMEAKTLAFFMESRKDVPLAFYELMGMSPIPKIRVHGVGTWPEPPKQWEGENPVPMSWKCKGLGE